MTRTGKKGFTLIELLVVIAIIALLLSIVTPALNRAKIYAQKIMCSNNLKQQALATMVYANEMDSAVPTSGIGPWLWDISFWCTNELSRYAGITDNKVFFCPANRRKQPDDARYWQYSWVAGTHATVFHSPIPLQDESKLNRAQQNSYYRVPPYLYMFDKYDSDGDSILNNTLQSGQRAQWIRKLSALRNAGSTIMITDVVMSAAGSSTNFFEVPGGIALLGGPNDNSNHESRQRLYTGTNPVGPKPDGANMAYADGHVDWKDFGPPPPNSDIKHQYTQGQWFWW